MDKYDGGPAFPTKDAQGNIQPGMSLRDWFAGQALAGIMGNSRLITVLADSKIDPAYCAYDMADSMLAEREVQRD